MTVVTMEEAKGRLDELASLANRGESVWIRQDQGAALELRPGELPTATADRVPGGWEGKIHIGPEFFEDLPDDELDLWEGNSPRGKALEEIGAAWARENRKALGSGE